MYVFFAFGFQYASLFGVKVSVCLFEALNFENVSLEGTQ